MRLRTSARRALCCAAALFAFAGCADAAPVQIGQIFVSNDPFAGLGPVFTVENDSGFACDPTAPTTCYTGNFDQVVMSVTGSSDTGPLNTSFTFIDSFNGSGIIAAGAAFDSSTLDLSDPSIIFSQALFTLNFTLPGSLSIAPLVDFANGSSTAILFTPTIAAAVPEPATWLLLGTGLALITIGRRRRRADVSRRVEPATVA